MNKLVAFLCLIFLPMLTLHCQSSQNLEWHEEDGFRWAELSVPTRGKVGFSQLPPAQTGIAFRNRLTQEQIARNRNLLNGSGVAVGDMDQDGLVDVYFCRLNGSNVLYKNLGNWKFKDVTEEAGVACAGQFSTGCTFADIDGDGDLDLLVTALGGPNACFLNDGHGKFVDVTEQAGLKNHDGSTTMALADIDGDGDLDLYIANYKVHVAKEIFSPQELAPIRILTRVGGKYKIVSKYKDHFQLDSRNGKVFWTEIGEPDRLFLNDGQGHFVPVDFSHGRFLDEAGHRVALQRDWSLTVRFQDINDDGAPDIYVCNDFESPDRVWLNDGTGRFRAIPRLALRSTSASSMAVDFSDIDRDGDLDFFVAEMLSRKHGRRKTQMGIVNPKPLSIGAIDNRPQYMRNTLFLNRGDNTYAEIAQFSGVEASEWSWSALFLDVDLDGYEDLLISNGHVYDVNDRDTNQWVMQQIQNGRLDFGHALLMFPSLKTPNVAFHNRGDWRFAEVGEDWGIASRDITHGMALGDFDNDGDLDLVTNRYDAPAGVYRNETTAPRIAVRLRGLAPNTRGIGAKIQLSGGRLPQSKEVICGGLYVSGSDPLAVFAAGEAKNRLSVTVTWRNGKQSTVKDLQPNRIYEIEERTAHHSQEVPDSTSRELQQTYFKDVSNSIDHRHHEDPYDDFSRQPLLPRRLSQLGPGVAWQDVDDDGLDDLLIGTGKGGALAGYRNDGQGGFQKIEDSAFSKISQQDQTALLGSKSKNGPTTLLASFSDYEDTPPSHSYVLQYVLKNGRVKRAQKMVVPSSSIGPMCLADYDGDGDLDLFVGGRTVPARYPEPASSYLYLNENGTFHLDLGNEDILKNLGLVSGAVFSDLDNDGDADLVLALEWGPVAVLKNNQGRFADATEASGLSKFKGWWNGVTTGDFNEDGRLDIVATNWGCNNKYHCDPDRPLRIYYDDFDNNGTMDVVEAYYDPDMKAMVPERGLSRLSRAMPFVGKRTPTYKAFGAATLEKIIGPGLARSGMVEVNTLAHTLFLNQGDSFKAVPLPAYAQLAPAFYVGVSDFDGDGHEDVFLSQNFFAVQ
ncbi:MAG: FG-GAP repeat domain-containing protein, partial [bacterium]